MTFYIDKNISTSLAEAFNILQQGLNDDFKRYGTITVKSVVVEFGAGTEDEVWIPLAGKERGINKFTFLGRLFCS